MQTYLNINYVQNHANCRKRLQILNSENSCKIQKKCEDHTKYTFLFKFSLWICWWKACKIFTAFDSFCTFEFEQAQRLQQWSPAGEEAGHPQARGCEPFLNQTPPFVSCFVLICSWNKIMCDLILGLGLRIIHTWQGCCPLYRLLGPSSILYRSRLGWL